MDILDNTNSKYTRLVYKLMKRNNTNMIYLVSKIKAILK